MSQARMHDVSRNDSVITATCAYENTNQDRQSKPKEHDFLRASLLISFSLVDGGAKEKNLRADLKWVGDKNLDRTVIDRNDKP
jgi:hypothetical protein